MRIALAQLNLLIGDVSGAAAAIRAAAKQAHAQGAALLICPELAALGGYPPRDLLERQSLIRMQWEMVHDLARDLPLPALIGCAEPLEAGSGPPLANAVAALAQGRIIATYHKRLLPTYDVFDERRYFRAGTRSCIVPIAGLRVGLTVCEDIWTEAAAGVRYQQDPVRELSGACDLIVNCSASPYDVGKPALRGQVVANLARRCHVPVAYCNQVGGHDELLFDGDSCLVGADGSRLAQAPRWEECVQIADLECSGAPPAAIDILGDLYQGLVVGLRDYCRKTGQARVVLGLSGGIDSALVASLAVDALGPAQVTGLLMPGPYSSPGSVSDALALSDNLGIAHHTLDIRPDYSQALTTLAPIFAGSAAGVAEENLQSRLRGTLLMAAANKMGAMALTTGNKSEIAVGYCTIYGDMNGGLAPIGDLYKTTVWQLARWRNSCHTGFGKSRGRAPIPEESLLKPPSAELAPGQTDQDSLPPYDELDRILKRHLEHGDGAAELIAAGEKAGTVARILHLVESAEFKRRQGAPILRVSPKAFGIGRRMPLARHVP